MPSILGSKPRRAAASLCRQESLLLSCCWQQCLGMSVQHSEESRKVEEREEEPILKNKIKKTYNNNAYFRSHCCSSPSPTGLIHKSQQCTMQLLRTVYVARSTKAKDSTSNNLKKKKKHFFFLLV